MDLVTVTGYKTVAALMSDDGGMDNYEWQCWQQYWKENLFGPFATSYQASQQAVASLHAFGGKFTSEDIQNSMVRMLSEEDISPEVTEEQQEQAAYMMMIEFKGKAAADEWRGLKNANN